MGAAYYLIVENSPGRQTRLDGKALARDQKRIDALAASEGLGRLDDFFSISPEEARQQMADVLDATPDELPEEDEEALASLPPVTWHDATIGLAFASTLADRIRQDSSLVHHPDAVLRDLDAMAADMADLQEEKLRWRFAVDY